jgi:hypothetical protein
LEGSGDFEDFGSVFVDMCVRFREGFFLLLSCGTDEGNLFDSLRIDAWSVCSLNFLVLANLAKISLNWPRSHFTGQGIGMFLDDSRAEVVTQNLKRGWNGRLLGSSV